MAPALPVFAAKAAPTKDCTRFQILSKTATHKGRKAAPGFDQFLRIFSTIAVVELFSTSPSTFTIPP